MLAVCSMMKMIPSPDCCSLVSFSYMQEFFLKAISSKFPVKRGLYEYVHECTYNYDVFFSLSLISTGGR